MKQFFIGIDQTLNCVVPIKGDGFGWADETLSARLFRCYIQGLLSEWPYSIVDKIFFWQECHCFSSWRSEFERRQLPDHYR